LLKAEFPSARSLVDRAVVLMRDLSEAMNRRTVADPLLPIKTANLKDT
jgi:hypothetical protein